MEDLAAVAAAGKVVVPAEEEALGRQTAARPRANVDVVGDESAVLDDVADDAVQVRMPP